MKLETHRGITTNPTPKNENTPVVITNRLHQLSLSLPRIDDKKRFAGFPGLSGWAAKLAKLIPKSKFYVEPFAGMAKVYQEIDKSKIQYAVLNDKAKYLANVLRKEFPEANVTNTDYAYCIKKYDTPETFFLIDEPWNKFFYAQGFSSFTEESVKQYDEKVLKLCRNIQGKFIVTTKNSKVFKNSEFNNATVKSIYTVCGNYPEILITTNLKLGRNNY